MPNSIRRVFLGWDRPVLPRAADLLLDEAAPHGGEPGGRTDLRGILVALPVARAGRRLRELLLEGAETRGVRLVPPEITTVGALPERIYRPRLPAPDPVLERAAWTAALRKLPERERALLLADPPDDGDEPGWARIARTLRSLHRDVGAGLRDFREVGEACRDLPYNDEARWRALARVQDAYREILDRSGRRDRERARREALSSGSLRVDRALWVVGAVDIHPVVRRFLVLTEGTAPHTVLVPAPDAFAERFDEVGCVRPETWTPEDLPSVAGRIRVASDPGEQADAVMETLAAAEGALAPEEVTVGVPDPEVVPYLVERLSSQDVPVRHPPGRAVERTSLFRLLGALADYVESREYRAFATLLRHPAVERTLRSTMAGEVPASLPALADRFHAAHLPAYLEAGALPRGGEWSGEPLQPKLTDVRDALDRLLAPLQGKRPLREWAKTLGEVVVAFHGDARLHRAREADRETLVMGDRLRQVLEGFQGLPGLLDPAVGADRALRILLEDLRERDPVPPGADAGAVELLGWLELALDDAAVLVVTGMNEPHVPEAVTAHPFLPDALRARLGLLDNRRRWARDLVHLRMILESRRAAALVAGRRDGEGNPLRLSRLLLGGTPEEVARRLREFLGDDSGEVRKGPPPVDASDEAGDRAPAFRLPPEPELSAPAPPDRISVTAFRRLLEDPYLYALDRVLDLRTVDDRAREMDGLLFGILAHRVLERWGGSAARESDEEETIRETLEGILKEEVRARFGPTPLPAVHLQVAQLRTRLAAFARWQASWRAEGWEVRAVEAEPAGEGVAFDVDGRPILLRGRIDRVDHHPERGEWLLLDYKTGDRVDGPEKTHRRGPKADRHWVDLQLPLYRHLAPALRTGAGAGAAGREVGSAEEAGSREGAGPLIPPDALGEVGLGYVALGREEEKVGALLAEWSEKELEQADETAREAVRVLRANVFRFDARARVRPGDPLAPLLGKGILALYSDREAGDG